jgi:hypothetical protein
MDPGCGEKSTSGFSISIKFTQNLESYRLCFGNEQDNARAQTIPGHRLYVDGTLSKSNLLVRLAEKGGSRLIRFEENKR